MRAAVLKAIPATRLDFSEVSDPHVSRDNDVVVQVEACGICGTDLHILAGESYRPALPFVLGHEPAGRVVDAGANARNWLDERVTTTLFEGCGNCDQCQVGDERLCPNLRSIIGVLERPGAFADRFVVPAAQLVRVPASLSSVRVAALADAGATAMNATRIVLEYDYSRVVVVGGGPVGMLVAELLSHAGRPPMILEANPTRREGLASLDHLVVGDPEELNGPIDCFVECSGSPKVPGWAVARLTPRGLLVLAGYSSVPDMDLAPIARKELAVRGVRSGSRSDLEAVLTLASERQIALPTIRTWRLEDINVAFAALREGTLDGKAVILLSTTTPKSDENSTEP